MKTFVIGDIHGGYKALLQCLERSGFNEKEDVLISLGDICDGWSEVYECVEKLLKLNTILIRGNHDDWFCEFLTTGSHGSAWMQGGDGTLKSYCKALNKKYFHNVSDILPFDIPETHVNFFLKQQKPFYIDTNNNLFVHGGFNRHFDINDKIYNSEDILMWDRDLWLNALSYKEMNGEYKFKMFNKFKEVFIGHTSTINWKTDKPMKAANIWNLDTGGGFNGKLTIMNVDTKEYWQSDLLTELYPDEKGRN